MAHSFLRALGANPPEVKDYDGFMGISRAFVKSLFFRKANIPFISRIPLGL